MPGVKRFAGTFPAGSGPNCFGTVMAAAGVINAVDEWMQQDPFDQWLATRCRPVTGTGNVSGTVLVWRDEARVAQRPTHGTAPDQASPMKCRFVRRQSL